MKVAFSFGRVISCLEIDQVCRCCVVGRVPAIQPGGLGSIPGGSGILISVLGLGVCLLSVFWTVWSPAVALTLC